MRTIIQFLRQHLREDFRWDYYLAIAGWLAFCISFNYLHAPDGYRSWEVWIIKKYYLTESPWRIGVYFLFYAFAYFTAAGITAVFHPEQHFWKKSEFWLRSSFILAVISVQAGLGLHRYLIPAVNDADRHYFLMKIVAPLTPVILVGIPLFLFWYLRDRRKGIPWMYGLSWDGFTARPYLILLALMLPVILWASFQPQFLNYYPTLGLHQTANANLIRPPWLAFAVYELIYGLYFVWAEIIFRGFLTIGMRDTMDRHAVVPMTGLYAFRHFAKPPGETIGSVLGGYILGVIALRGNNVVGGAIIHGAIAVLMDVLAYWQHH